MTRPPLLVLTGIAAAALTGCGDGDGDGSSPEDTVNTFVAALMEGDAEEVCALFTEQAQQSLRPGTYGLPENPCGRDEIPEDERNMVSGASVALLEESEDEALVQVTPQTGDPPIALTLTMEGDEWRIAEPASAD